jgi:hypothetical protein
MATKPKKTSATTKKKAKKKLTDEELKKTVGGMRSVRANTHSADDCKTAGLCTPSCG